MALGKIKIRCYFTHMGVTRPHGKPGLGGKQVINSIWGLVEFSPSEPHGPVLMWTHQPQEGPEFTSPQLASCCCAFPPHSGHPLVSISSVILFCICLVLFWRFIKLCFHFSFVTACLCFWLYFTNIASACRTACVDLNCAFARCVEETLFVFHQLSFMSYSSEKFEFVNNFSAK